MLHPAYPLKLLFHESETGKDLHGLFFFWHSAFFLIIVLFLFGDVALLCICRINKWHSFFTSGAAEVRSNYLKLLNSRITQLVLH